MRTKVQVTGLERDGDRVTGVRLAAGRDGSEVVRCAREVICKLRGPPLKRRLS